MSDPFKCENESPCKGANDNFDQECEAAIHLDAVDDFEYKPTRYIFCPYCGVMINHDWKWLNLRLFGWFGCGNLED